MSHHHQQQQQDFYEVLGVRRTADKCEIDRAYKRLSLANHPDRCGGNADAVARFQVKK